MFFSFICYFKAKLDIPFGTHHTKMMFLLYKEGFRIVIHTSNIVDSDWFQRTQGMWVSPVLPALKCHSATEGNSPTNFKTDLLEYISSYGAPGLDKWIDTIKKHDFSKIRVILIGSVPGRHLGSKKTAFGHLKMRKILNLHGSPKDIVQPDWPLICQFSSIGSLGASPDQWLLNEFCTSLSTTKDAPIGSKSSSLKLVFPTVENVRKSLQGYPAGASLPYSIKVAQKQPYLKNYLHQWKSERFGRSEASPHIKTYVRLSPNNSNIAWFLLTSANLSKAAWGALEKKGSQFMIRSYELGVLFLPKFFVRMELFSTPACVKKDLSKLFPIPYDIPLEPYSKNDEPWIWDIPHIKAPDRHGMMWCPP
ncbi:tyrosyl-DNA phosphodiesterase 1 [Caerostris extrusa]|uniref:Tyrosyl-DNA phosphodiesterase 1 n=1 Tax=Caerostris extrusa TaxID=172846 RepID=A0AAV4V4F1_CAEEX|nr:tyrosyl-DNA phosphodiesterase 1 [Caerostris extrusa]